LHTRNRARDSFPTVIRQSDKVFVKGKFIAGRADIVESGDGSAVVGHAMPFQSVTPDIWSLPRLCYNLGAVRVSSQL
jgi:hypothetical protein